MSIISAIARDAVYVRLADPANGLNPLVASWSAAYGATPFAVDWTATSPNFFIGNLDLGDLLESAARPNPVLVCLYGEALMNQNRVKFSKFAGSANVGLKIYYTWPHREPAHNMEAPIDLLKDALVEIFNRAAAWPAHLSYNGEVSVSASPIGRGAQHWQCLVQAQAAFQVTIYQS